MASNFKTLIIRMRTLINLSIRASVTKPSLAWKLRQIILNSLSIMVNLWHPLSSMVARPLLGILINLSIKPLLSRGVFY